MAFYPMFVGAMFGAAALPTLVGDNAASGLSFDMLITGFAVGGYHRYVEQAGFARTRPSK